MFIVACLEITSGDSGVNLVTSSEARSCEVHGAARVTVATSRRRARQPSRQRACSASAPCLAAVIRRGQRRAGPQAATKNTPLAHRAQRGRR